MSPPLALWDVSWRRSKGRLQPRCRVIARGENAWQVRRSKIKLADKQSAIERLNGMFGWITDRSEVGRPGEFANLTDEQLDGIADLLRQRRREARITGIHDTRKSIEISPMRPKTASKTLPLP